MRREAPSSLYRSGETFHLDLKARIGKDCRLYQIFQALSEVVWSEYDVWGTDRDPVATLHTGCQAVTPSCVPLLNRISHAEWWKIPSTPPARHFGDQRAAQTPLGMSG